MSDEADLPLAAEFAPATREDWRKLVDAALKGAPYDRLVSKTCDGLKIEPIYERARSAPAIPMRHGEWRVTQRVDHPDGKTANAQALHDLENGATGMSIVFAGAVGASR